MSTILVTGNRGFIGGHLVAALTKQGHVVHGLDLVDNNDIRSCKLVQPWAVDRVFHLAAQTSAYTEMVSDDALNNILGSIRIFERYGNKVVYTSSSMVNYPLMPYAISKLAAEHYARYYGAAIVRLCNIYGFGGHSVIDKFNAQSELTIFGDGNQVRTYAGVGDAVAALIQAKPGTTTILPGETLSVNEIIKKYQPNKPVHYVPALKLHLHEGRQLY